jgi:rod shape-determining protein MreC
VRRTVLAPLVWLQQRAVEGRTSRARFDAAEAQRDTATLQARALAPLAAENAALRLLVGLAKRPELTFVPAEILHQPQPSDARSLLLSAGARQGVEPFQPVLTPEGLLGVVRTADPGQSVAMTWAHPEFRASAVTADGSVSGIVAATSPDSPSESLMELRGVPYRDSIAVGTLVVTSGLGGVYPRGIPVGTVVAQVREQKGWERVYLLRPAASPSYAVHVMVVTGSRASTLLPVFPVDSTLTRPDTTRAAPAAAATVPPPQAEPVERPRRDSAAVRRPPRRAPAAAAPARDTARDTAVAAPPRDTTPRPPVDSAPANPPPARDSGAGPGR